MTSNKILICAMLMATTIVMAIPSEATDYTSASYVQDGMITQWDGIDNVGTGTHNPSATVWKDLKGNLDLTLTGNGSWTNGNALSFGKYAAYGDTVTPTYKTIEIVFLRRSGIVVFHSGIQTRYVLAQRESVYFDGTDKDTMMFHGPATTNEIVCASAIYNDNNAVSDLFCDGERKIDGTIKNNWGLVPPYNVSIGGRTSGEGYPASGNIYAIRLYSRRLTKAELAHNNMVDRKRFMTSDCYVQDGLVTQWDGIDNAGTGTHNPSATVWKDLKGNLDLTLTANGCWTNGNALAFDKYAAYGSTVAPTYKTIDIVFSRRSGIVVFHSGIQTRYVLVQGGHVYFDGANRDTMMFNGPAGADEIVCASALYNDSNAVSDLFCDGERKTDGTIKNNWGLFQPLQVSIGGRISTESYPASGSMYAIRLYSRRLSEKEIAGNAAMDQKRIFAPRQMTWKNLSDGNFVVTNNWTVSGTGGQNIPRYSDRVVLPAGDYAATLNEDWAIGDLSIGAGAALKFTLPSDASATNVVRLTAFGKVEADASARIVLDAEAFCNAYKKGSVMLLSCDVASPTALQRLADNVSFVGAHASRDRVEVSDDGKSLVYTIPPPGLTFFVR